MDEHRELLVPNIKVKERIDSYITGELKWPSRSRIKNLIKENKVLINGKITKPSTLVQSGDKIEILIPPVKKLEAKPQNIPIKIIYQDKNLMLVNKEAGIVVHPAFGNHENTLVNALLYHIKDLSGINGVLRPGIVHRLDKDTSGIIIISKDDATHAFLARQFVSRTMEKVYYAVIFGRPKERYGIIDKALGRGISN
ncbi:pseudouridine synthase, partial [candidate division KSB1 bacterium]